MLLALLLGRLLRGAYPAYLRFRGLGPWLCVCAAWLRNGPFTTVMANNFDPDLPPHVCGRRFDSECYTQYHQWTLGLPVYLL